MSFSEQSLSKKFQELNNTQQSVQTLSLWLIHHRKHSRTIVNSWLRELVNSPKCERKLTFIYLANDILQNSRKKGYEYMQEFANVLPEAIENTAKVADSKIRFTLERILNIWKDRKIYPDESIDKLKTILHSSKSSGTPTPTNETTSTTTTKSTKSPSEIKKPTSTIESKTELDNVGLTSKKRRVAPEEQAEPVSSHNLAEMPSSKTTNKSSLREEILKELAQNGNNIQPPESLELITMLQDLEKSASSDAVVREKIAELPSKVNDLNALKNLKDKKEAIELSNTVNDALTLLDNYNFRLQQELVNRKQTALSLAAYIRHQQREADNDTKLIEEWQRKYKQVKLVRHELQIHLESLPDLSSIEEAATLTPLPSAGDLFSS